MKLVYKILSLVLIIAISIIVVSCKSEEAQIDLPETTQISSESKMPIIKMYNINTKSVETLEFEDYICGVLAGEIFNSWPIESLKAQAILARTFTLHFLQNRISKYEGANISNDISEAQAYDSSKINELIKQAVKETQGKVVMSGDQLVQTWFHSNSGGKTTTAKNGLNFRDEESHTTMVDSPETSDNSENFSWNKTFLKSDILTALRTMGITVDSLTTFEIGEKDESGRAKTFKIGTIEFSANTFRSKIGSTEFKSTLIDEIVVSKTLVSFTGRGYGHGVGLSQWGAKILAEEGKTCEEIINHYFQNIKIEECKF